MTSGFIVAYPAVDLEDLKSTSEKLFRSCSAVGLIKLLTVSQVLVDEAEYLANKRDNVLPFFRIGLCFVLIVNQRAYSTTRGLSDSPESPGAFRGGGGLET